MYDTFDIRRLYAYRSDGGDDGGGDNGGDDSNGGGDDGSVSNSANGDGLENDSTSIPAWETPPIGDEKSQEAFTKLIPEAYRDKPYLKDAKSLDDVFKQLDNTQSLIGKKTVGVPEADAPPEKWDEYYKNIRPKDVSEYEFEKYTVPDEVEGKEALQTVLAETEDPEFEKGLKEVFYKAGLNKSQAAIIQKGANDLFMQKFGGLYKATAEAKASQDADFEEIATKKFGANKDSVIANGKQFLEENMPNEFKEFLPAADNKFLIAMAAWADNIRRKYVREDGKVTGNMGTEPRSKDEVSEQGRKLMSHPAFSDKFHPEHDAIIRQVNENYQRLNTIQSGRRK